jgi:lipid-binding SYLF domain-containing protein
MNRTRTLLLAAAALALTACASESDPQLQAENQAARRGEIDAQADAALQRLYAQNEAARTLGERAKGILVCPEVFRAGFIVGGQTGNCALQVDGTNVAYYNTSAASIGLQAGAQGSSQAIMFMTDEALQGFRDGSGWEAGVDGSVTVINTATAGSVNTNTFRDPIVAFVWGQSGLLAGVSLAGTKYTRLNL